MSKKNIEAIYPLSPMQEAMLTHSLTASWLYFEQVSCTLEGLLDVDAFRRAWEELVSRHAALRTSFRWEGLERPMQIVHRRVELPWEEYDWRDLPDHSQRARFENLLQEGRKRGLDPKKAPMLRLALIDLGNHTRRFIWGHHHVILDGWSAQLLLSELFHLYEAYSKGPTVNLKPVRPYSDYIAWLKSQDLSDAENFWRRVLCGFTTPISLKKFSSEEGPRHEYGDQGIRLSREGTAGIQALARKRQLTLNAIVQGAWALVLSIYSGNRDVLFGAVVSGRPPELEGAESMIGLFINTLPVRMQVDPEEELIPWLGRLLSQQIEARRYEYTPLTKIQGWSDVAGGIPLFESVMVFQNLPAGQSLTERSQRLRISESSYVGRTDYPVTLTIHPGEEMTVQASYAREVFDDATVLRMLRLQQTLLEGMASSPLRRLCDLPRLNAEEEKQLLGEPDPAPPQKIEDCIDDLVKTQSQRTPEAIALVFEDRHLSFSELNRRTDQVAALLADYLPEPESLVALYANRSLESVIGLLGILRAGAAYSALNPDHPEFRNRLILDQIRPPALLISESLLNHLPPYDGEIICIEETAGSRAKPARRALTSLRLPDSLAYVVFTSGSTGKPKGVAGTHSGVVNYLRYLDSYQLSPADTILQLAPLSFDASIRDLIGPLVRGAKVALVEERTSKDCEALLRIIERENVTAILSIVPTQLRELVEVAARGKIVCDTVKTILVSGERFDLALAREAKRVFGELRYLVNQYGPTECTLTSSFYPVKTSDENGYASLGIPIPNARIYVLDHSMNLAPKGFEGEFYIGGAGLSRGYWKQADWTAERFLPHPYREPAARLYRTGDLGRHLEDGTLQFIGRKDEQVKVRGNRVELGEIDATLRRHPGVADAVTVAREEIKDDKQLIAYVVLKEQDTGIAELRRHLEKQLPSYLMPHKILTLERMPLTPNGKIDRKALSAAEPAPVDDQSQQAPRSAIEEIVAAAAAQVLGLGLERIDLRENFLELGGHSLKAVRLISQIRHDFGVEIPLRSVLEEPTLAALARQVEIGLGQHPSPPIRRRPRQGQARLSFAQQRLWFLQQFEPANPSYNIPLAARVEGRLDICVLEKCLAEVEKRHEILRTTFKTEKGEVVQVIGEAMPVKIPTIDLSMIDRRRQAGLLDELKREEARRPFDLTRGPLVRAALLRLSEQEHIALFTMHHIISDGWSMSVLVHEVGALYEAFIEGRESPLPELPIQFADYAEWQREWLEGEALETRLAYWKARLGGSPQLLNLPIDRRRTEAQRHRGTGLSVNISSALLQRLEELSREHGVTLYMTLLAAFQTLLYRYSGQTDVIVATPVAGRNRAETEALIGCFVNTLVMRTDLSGNPRFSELLRRVREVALGAYAHQDLPFDKLVEELRLPAANGGNPLSNVMFVMQNLPATQSNMGPLSLAAEGVDHGTSKFDLLVTIYERADSLFISGEYDTDLFEAGTIAEMLRRYTALLESFANAPQLFIDEAPLLSESETGGLRPSDFQQVSLSQKELENLLTELKNARSN